MSCFLDFFAPHWTEVWETIVPGCGLGPAKTTAVLSKRAAKKVRDFFIWTPGNRRSLRSIAQSGSCTARASGPSRVKINALRAPLTALPVRGGCVCVFQFLVCFFLDRAHAFIDGHRNLLLRYPSKGIQADQEVDAGDAVGQLGPCVNGLFQFRPPRTPKLSSS
jgi:hypothetical protein